MPNIIVSDNIAPPPANSRNIMEILSALSSSNCDEFPIGSPEAIVARTRDAWYRRLEQRRIFPEAVFREYCWDILLLCFISQAEGRQICIKQIRNQLDQSNTALLRRIDELEHAGVVRRLRDDLDGRRTTVRLTSEGFNAMVRFFDYRPYPDS